MQRELVERAQRGDHDAFADLAKASLPRLYGAAKLILRDEDRAQDAVQEALVLAWKHVRALREPDAWDAWLYRLNVRACYRAARQAKRRTVAELHLLPDVEPVAPSDLTLTVAERDQVGRALDRLPIEQRAVLVLHFFIGLPLTEAADVLDIPPGTAKSRLHRGLESLRDSMATDAPRPASQAGERLA